ncbi:hypothetical protein HQ545_07315 [Candidatus Woesearchaeota archaeon]|nr:hypothetical protein [Candidatus Woesearchaeota archaeon]
MAKRGETNNSNARKRHTKKSLLKKEEEFIEKEAKWLFGPNEFHITTLVASLLLLALILYSFSLVFFVVLTVAAVWFAHFLNQHHRPHDFLAILWIFFLPLMITAVLFRDLLVYLLLGIYCVSAISTIIIYYYHKKEHSPLKIMWQVTYSKIVAITLAMLVLCVLPLFIFPDTFLSITELVFLYIMPAVFVFFFATKFLYLYFFDRKHVWLDLRRSLKHTVLYSMVFLVVVVCIYSLFAVGMYNQRSEIYDEGIDNVLIDVANIQKSIIHLPEDMRRLVIMKDVESFANELESMISVEKGIADEHELSFADVIDDSYFTQMSENSFTLLRLFTLDAELLLMKDGVVTVYNSFDGLENIDYSIYRSEVEESFVDFSQDPDMIGIMDDLQDDSLTPSYFENNGFFYWFADSAGIDFVYRSKSIFVRQLSLILRQSVIFRDLSRMVLKVIVFSSKESVSPSAAEHIYANRGSDLTDAGAAIRYSLLARSIDVRKNVRVLDFGGGD